MANRSMMFTFRLEIPALDALVDYLQKQDQSKVDRAAALVADATGKLKTNRQNLIGAIPK